MNSQTKQRDRKTSTGYRGDDRVKAAERYPKTCRDTERQQGH